MLHVARSPCWPIWTSANRRAPGPTILSLTNNRAFYKAQHRSSSSQKHASAPIKSKTIDPPPLDTINAPLTTLPPKLDLPHRDPSLPIYKYYFRLGRAYAGFYKTGLKQIYQNLQAARQLPVGPFTPRSRLQAALSDATITRGQYHLLLRVRSDVSRLPLFALVFLCCGEFTPLVVPFLGFVVPKTVWLPSQWEKARKKAQERRGRAEGRRKEGKTAGLNGEEYMVGDRLRAWPEWWERVPIGVSEGRLRRRVEAVLKEVRTDDAAIVRGGGVKALSLEEVKLALDARGVDVLKRDKEELRRSLEKSMDANAKLVQRVGETRRRDEE